jgi:glycosyltransferase involved in cell wall biosynthesis
MADVSAPLGLLPPLGGSLSDLARTGQVERLLDYYFPAYLEVFETIRYFSYEPERLEAFTQDRELRRRVDVLAPQSRVPRHLRALSLGLGPGRKRLRECSLARAMQAPGAIPALLAGVPYVCTYGYSYPAFTRARFGGELALPAKRALLRRSLAGVVSRARLVFVTSPLLDVEARRLGATRVHVLPNGVDPSIFTPSDHPPVYDVVYVGELGRAKGVATLLDASAGLDLSVCVVGDGPERAALEDRAFRSGVRATFCGRMANREVASVLRRSKIFVLPSGREGHPKALLEAMSCGLACIGSDIPAIRELSADAAIMLFPPGDAQALRVCLRRVIKDEALRASLAAAARDAVERRFDLRRLLQEEAALLVELCRRRLPTAVQTGR